MSSDRHNVHYLFCHTILPGLAFGSGVQWDVFSAAFFGRDGPQVLSNLWNSMCGKFPELLTTADDFKREIRPVIDDWKAVVVTPPPALEGAEAHHIGVLIQLDPKRIAELSSNEKPIDDRSLAGTGILRYLCLERHVTLPSMTMIGEWLRPGERRNLGFGPSGSDLSPEAMFDVLAALVGGTGKPADEALPDLDLYQEGEVPPELLDLEAELEEAVADGRSNDEFECRSVLAQTYLHLTQPNRATVHCEALVELLTRLEGPYSERTMIWRGFLGRALTEGRRELKAIEVLSELLVDRDRLLGPEHRKTLTTRGHLARAMAFGGKISEGILAGEQLLTDRVRLFGDLDHSTLDTIGHLARFHYLAGNYETAVELTEEQLDKRRRVFRKRDPIIKQTRYNLDVYRSLANRAEDPLGDHRRRVETMADEMGSDHPHTLIARDELAYQLLFAGATDEAVAVLRALLNDRTRVLGSAEPATVATSVQYGTALRQSGQAVHSVRHLKNLIASVPTDATSPSPEHLDIRVELFQSLVETGELEEAVTELKLLGMDMAHLEPTHPLRRWVEEQIDALE